MYFVSKKLKKKYNITDERAALYEAAETWVDALAGRDFLGMYFDDDDDAFIHVMNCYTDFRIFVVLTPPSTRLVLFEKN